MIILSENTFFSFLIMDLVLLHVGILVSFLSAVGNKCDDCWIS